MRLAGVQRYHWARDVEEALSLLSAYQGKGIVVAGGVDLARSPRRDIQGLIDITGMGLSYVRREDGRLRIGATTTLSELLEHQKIGEYAAGVLLETLTQVACPAIRNMATLGGAVASAHPWADIPTVLLALGAEVRLRGEKEEKLLLEDLYRAEFRTLFRKNLVLEIVLPPWDGAFAFAKLTRNSGDIALLNCACGLGIEGGRIAWARVALGATPQRGSRLTWLEEALVGERPGDALWEKAEQEVRERAEVGDDRRASAAWRREVAGVIVRRALARAAKGATGDGR